METWLAWTGELQIVLWREPRYSRSATVTFVVQAGQRLIRALISTRVGRLCLYSVDNEVGTVVRHNVVDTRWFSKHSGRPPIHWGKYSRLLASAPNTVNQKVGLPVEVFSKEGGQVAFMIRRSCGHSVYQMSY